MSRPLTIEDAKLRGYSNPALKRIARRIPGDAQALEAGQPDAPPHLSAAEFSVWNATVALLEKRGTLTPGDGPSLALYAQTVVEHAAERARLDEEGRVIIVNRLDKHGHAILIHSVNPRVRVVRDLERQLTLLLRELGLTPLRRHQVRNAKGGASLTLEDLLTFGREA